MLLALACSDPPDPPPVPTRATSTATWVEWRSAEALVSRPIVVVRDVPGGELDRLVADVDVTTFFNDRFHPVFVEGQPAALGFYDGCGCVLVAGHPGSAAAIIEAANAVIVRPEARRCTHPPRPAPAVLDDPQACASADRGGL